MLQLLAANSTIMNSKIKIPNNTTIIYMSNIDSDYDIDNIYKYNELLKNLTFDNTINTLTNIMDLSIYYANDEINDSYFNIMNGVYTKYTMIQGLYNLPITFDIIHHNIKLTLLEKEQVEKQLIKYSLKKSNFSLNDLFNEINKSNRKNNINRIIILLASRKSFKKDINFL